MLKEHLTSKSFFVAGGGGLHDGGEQEMKMCIEWIVLIVFSEFVVDILLHAASDILGASAGAHAFIV